MSAGEEDSNEEGPKIVVVGATADSDELDEHIQEVNISRSPKSSSIDKFSIGGQTLNLPNVSNEDSLYYRIEALRVYLEKELTADVFLQAYRLLKELEEQDDEDEQVTNQLNKILAGKENYLSLLNQLLFCEDQYSQL